MLLLEDEFIKDTTNKIIKELKRKFNVKDYLIDKIIHRKNVKKICLLFISMLQLVKL